MTAYIVASYDITDPEGYKGYVPGVRPLLEKHGAQLLAADFDARLLEGEKRGVHVLLRFASEEAALGWYEDPDYAAVKKIRLDSCSNNSLVLIKQFVTPAD